LPAAASLAGVPRKEARAALTGLTRAHLLTEYAPGRFAFHNLLRAYASEQNDTLDSAAERRAAVRRALDHYLHSGYTAAQLLDPHRDPIKLAPPDSKVTPEDQTDYERALAWFEAEYTILLAAINQAVSGGFDTHAWQISWTLATFHDWQGHWHDWVTTQSTALAAAERLDDRDSQARTHRYLGRACIRLGSFNGARMHYQRSLELYRDLGDRAGQAHAHLGLTKAFEQPGQQGEALGHAEQALREYSAAGHKAGQARALNAVGWSHALLGHHQQAITHCQEALSLQQDIGDPRGEAATWDSLGYAHHHLGRYPEAISCYRHALDLNRNLCDRFEESDTLTRLGDAHQAASEPDAARDAWQQSLVILEDLHHPDADQVRAKLTLSDARSTRKRHDDTDPERR
jgi:tetratricopeptide (TPR) repeat protein